MSASHSSTSSSTSSGSASSSVTSNSPVSASNSAVLSMTMPSSVSSSTAYSPITFPSSSRSSTSATPSSSVLMAMSRSSSSVKSTLLRPLAMLTSASVQSPDSIVSFPRRSTTNWPVGAPVDATARTVERGAPTASADIVKGVEPEVPPVALGEAENDFTLERSTATVVPSPDRTAPSVERTRTPSGSTTVGSDVS